MAKLIMTVEQMAVREDWLKARKLGLGGSDIGTIMGINKYKSPLRLWLEKTSQQDEEDLSDNQYVRFGHKLEPVLAECFTEDTGLKVRRVGLMQHDEYPWALASIDRMIVGQNELLEIKTGGAFTGKNWEGDEMPDSYYCQVQWYLFVSGCERAHVYCLIGGNKPIYKVVERNEDDIQKLFDAAKEFWHKVQSNIMPDIDGHEDTGKVLAEQFPGGGIEGRISLPEDIANLLDERDRCNKAIKVSEEHINYIDNVIKSAMGGFETALAGERKITWKTTAGRTTVDSKKLKSDMPDIYANYVKIGAPYRVFKVEELKNG